MKLLAFPLPCHALRTLLAGVFGLALAAIGPLAAARSAPSGAVKPVAECSWDHPGLRPYMGDVVAAVDRYQDIPQAIRTRLKQRMTERDYDEFVTIERNAIVGKRDYEPGIREMHFGDGRVCNVVTRAKWTPAMRERGLVYCEQNQCILVPTVCRNVSRIRRIAVAAPPPQAEVPREPQEGGGGGNDGSAGWLMVQARAVQEPGWVPGRGSGPGMPPAAFLPPYSGGFGGPESPPLLPVPEAPTWAMLGIGALLVVAAGRRGKRDDDLKD